MADFGPIADIRCSGQASIDSRVLGIRIAVQSSAGVTSTYLVDAPHKWAAIGEFVVFDQAADLNRGVSVSYALPAGALRPYVSTYSLTVVDPDTPRVFDQVYPEWPNVRMTVGGDSPFAELAQLLACDKAWEKSPRVTARIDAHLLTMLERHGRREATTFKAHCALLDPESLNLTCAAITRAKPAATCGRLTSFLFRPRQL